MSLRAKITGTAFALIVTSLVTVAWTFTEHEKELLREQLDLRGQVMARNLARTILVPLEVGRKDEILAQVEGLLQEEDVQYAAIVAEDEKLTIAKGKDVMADVSRVAMPKEPPSGAARVATRELAAIACLEFAVPIVGTKAVEEGIGDDLVERPFVRGVAVVGLSERRMVEKVTEARNRVFTLIAGLIAASLVICALLIGTIVRPLRELTRGTKSLAMGNLDLEVKVRSGDELGELAEAFNHLSKRLKASYEEISQSNAQLAVANQELKNWNLKLEEQVAERTRRLSVANGKLEKLMAEKEDFLRAVSHDLNAPLRNIAGMADLLVRRHGDKLEQDVKDKLQRIVANVEKESDLIKELLELSRIQSKRQVFEEVDVGALLADVKQTLSFTLDEKRVKLSWPEKLPRIRCERNRVKQVFQNLIDNAVKYMGPQEAPEVDVGWKEMPDAHEFSVKDNGIGIRAEDRGTVFNVFRRGKDPWAAKVPGKGIGLATVKGIVETYKGEIEVDSEYGKGSTFRFTFAKSALTGGHGDGEAELD
ncbi:MAG: HAMP domain-containing sensor histidine kinase [Planctomycetota bacterium]